MHFLLDIILVVLGVAMVLYGADRLTEGASQLARRFNVGEMIIGLTIVAFGTSMPEFVISLMSALKGSSDLALGNIVGSNIFNTLLIVGVAAMIAPLTVAKETVTRIMPYTIFATIALIVICLAVLNPNFSFNIKGNTIQRLDGAILLLFFIVFMRYTIKKAKNQKADAANEPQNSTPQQSVAKNSLLILAGLTLLIWGSDIFVDAAVGIAQQLNVSESVIGLTIVAFGTSLPELATTVVAARKGSAEMAIGNVLGSNVFNILWIIGCTSVICPMQINDVTLLDLSMMLVSMMLLLVFSWSKYKVERWEGAVLTVVFLLYLTYLLINA